MLSAESPGAGSSQGQREAIPESGPALEVIEMANGETIWCVILHSIFTSFALHAFAGRS